MTNTYVSVETIGKLSSLCFNYDYFSSALVRMQEFYDLSLHSPTPSLMLFYGETGVGKTTIIDHFYNFTNKRHVSKANAVGRIVYRQVPANCTPKALASELLASFGDPAADKGTMSNMTRRIVHYLSEFKISLVILDEFQHLIETKSEKVLYGTADWLKSVTNEVRCSFLLSGLPAVQNVIEANPQLKRRVMTRFVLKPLPLDTQADLQRVQTLLGLFSEKMFFDNASVVASEPVARAIHYASGGAIGRMVNILKLTCLNAFRDGSAMLEKRHFEAAIEELVEDVGSGRRKRLTDGFKIL